MTNNFKDLIVPNDDTPYFYRRHEKASKFTLLMKLIKMEGKYPEIIDIMKQTVINNPEEINKKNSAAITPLMIACANHQTSNSIESVKLLIKLGANINDECNKGMTSLIYAICGLESNNLECINLLIKSGTDINKKTKFGCTSLMYACQINDKLDLVYLLVNNGANINDKNNNGKTSLMYASEFPNLKGSIETIRLLINMGADVNEVDFEKNTSLMYACSNVHSANAMECVKLLVNFEADVDHKNKTGDTCLMGLFNNGIIKVCDNVIETIMLLIHESRFTICDRNNRSYTAYDYYVKNNHNFLSDEQLEHLRGPKVLSAAKFAKKNL